MLKKIKVLLFITITALVLPRIAATAPCDVECERNKLRYLERECNKDRDKLFKVQEELRRAKGCSIKMLPHCEAKLTREREDNLRIRKLLATHKDDCKKGGRLWNEARNEGVQE